jgi:hypothetical protein
MPRPTIIIYRKRRTRLAVQTGQTHAETGIPLLPHEQDESPDEARTLPDTTSVRGYVDVSKGLVDTDRRQDAGATFEAARRKEKVRRRIR